MRLSKPSPLQLVMICVVAACTAYNLYVRLDHDYVHPRRVSALFEAIRDGRVDEVDRLTRSHASLVNVYVPKEPVVQPFSPHRGDESTNLFATPLAFAILRGNVRIARLLVERGASLASRNHSSSDPLYDLEDGLQLHRLPFGDPWDRQVSPLHLAVMANNRALVELFLEKGVNVNVADRTSRRHMTTEHYDPVGGTPLHCAAALDHVEMATLLIARGGDVNDRDLLGRTPLDLARESHLTEVARVLVAAGGRPGVPRQRALPPPPSPRG